MSSYGALVAPPAPPAQQRTSLSRAFLTGGLAVIAATAVVAVITTPPGTPINPFSGAFLHDVESGMGPAAVHLQQAGYRSYAEEGFTRHQGFERGKENDAERHTTHFNVPNDAMFDNMDNDHLDAHNTYGTYSQFTGNTSKGVVTLEGDWTEKQLENFEDMSIEEQHDFYKHYNQRDNRHDKGLAQTGARGAGGSGGAHCEANKALKRCFVKNEVQCSEDAVRCIWSTTHSECTPRVNTCENPPTGADEDTCPTPCQMDDGSCDSKCWCKADGKCLWIAGHTPDPDGSEGVDSRVHVGNPGNDHGPKAENKVARHKFSRVCDMCDYFGVDGNCDQSNFVRLVKEQGLVEAGGAGTCLAKQQTGTKCFIECAPGHTFSSPIYCRHRNGRTAVGPDQIPTCIGKPCVPEAPPNGNLGNCGPELASGEECTPGCDDTHILVGAGGGVMTCSLGNLTRPTCEIRQE